MAKTTLAFFEVKDETYIQSIDTSTDKVTIHDVDENTILEIDSRARVTDANGAVGDFRIETVEGVDCWVYYENPLRTRTVCGRVACRSCSPRHRSCLARWKASCLCTRLTRTIWETMDAGIKIANAAIKKAKGLA